MRVSPPQYTRLIILAGLVGLLTAACDSPPVVNRAPVAFAGFDRSIRLGEDFFLDASRSNDPDGNALHYKWWVQSPSGTRVALTDQATVVYTAQELGIYVVTLIVDDGELSSAADLCSITVFSTNTDTGLHAHAGTGQVLGDDLDTSLDGSGSFGPGPSSPLSYNWSIVDAPDVAREGENFTFEFVHRSDPVLTLLNPTENNAPDISEGVFVFSLRVSNDQDLSDPDFVSVAVGRDRTDAIFAEAQEPVHTNLGSDDTASFHLDAELYALARISSTPQIFWWVINAPAGDGVDATCPKPGDDLRDWAERSSVDIGLTIPLASLEFSTSCAGLWQIMICPQGPTAQCQPQGDNHVAMTASCCQGLADFLSLSLEEFSP